MRGYPLTGVNQVEAKKSSHARTFWFAVGDRREQNQSCLEEWFRSKLSAQLVLVKALQELTSAADWVFGDKSRNHQILNRCNEGKCV